MDREAGSRREDARARLDLVGIVALLSVALRDSLYRRDWRPARCESDDRRGNILLWRRCWGSFSESYSTKAKHGVLFLAFGGGRASASSRGRGLGRSVLLRPPPGERHLDRTRYLAAGLAPSGAVDRWVTGSSTGSSWPMDDLLASTVDVGLLMLNVAGSAGDMVMMRKVMSYPRAYVRLRGHRPMGS